jgi:hypothetical protein
MMTVIFALNAAVWLFLAFVALATAAACGAYRRQPPKMMGCERCGREHLWPAPTQYLTSSDLRPHSPDLYGLKAAPPEIEIGANRVVDPIGQFRNEDARVSCHDPQDTHRCRFCFNRAFCRLINTASVTYSNTI